MGFRFYHRIRHCPGVSVNVSGSGPSLSLGVRGAHVTFGRRGITRTVGVPGTGLFYTSRAGYHTGYHSAAAGATSPQEQAAADNHIERVIATVLVLAALYVFGVRSLSR
jgi:hypothetical protein